MPFPSSANQVLADLQGDAYLRQRLEPLPGQSYYLHLVDLRNALQPFVTQEPIKLLDFGSGGSPYRPLFPNAQYRRADFGAIKGLDYVLEGEEATIPEGDATFDLILSTQVAEHLRRPQQYFAECLRLLKPGGRLICTTHGTFEDHGVPYDYQRWTAAGLRQIVQEAGFDVVETRKLTTGARALLFQFDRHFTTLFCARNTFWGFFIWLGTRLYGHCRALIHRQADRHYRANKNVLDSEPGHGLYITLLLVARRPANGNSSP